MSEKKLRTIRKVFKGQKAVDGAGVKLVRVFGGRDATELDPFLMLDAFDSSNPEDYIKGFPWHPHRGIETITYLIRGDIEHGDSLGNKGSILDGDCQWMTAGSGIIHQEMPKASGRMLGCQLWLNLPARDKMVKPAYNGITKDDVPVVVEENSRTRIIAGEYRGTRGAFTGRYVNAIYLDVDIDPGAEWSIETDSESTLFVYLVEGLASFDPDGEEQVQDKSAVLFNKGDSLWIKAGERGVRLLNMSGRPLGEPIAWGGPIVMNTREELELAFRELDDGTFIK